MIKKVVYKGSEINYTIAGKGNAVVFLHGFLEDLSIWHSYSEKLSRNHKVITIDLPGFGNSEMLDCTHSMNEMAMAVNTVVEHEGIDSFIVIGHSMGGYVALAFASLFEHRLNGIILFHSHAGADSDEAKTNRNRTIKIIEGNHAKFISAFIPTLFAPENIAKHPVEIEKLIISSLQTKEEGIIAALVGMRDRNDFKNLLSKLNIPVFFIVGKKDSKITIETIQEQVILPKICEVLFLEDIGHMGFIESKNTIYNAINGFVNRYSSN